MTDPQMDALDGAPTTTKPNPLSPVITTGRAEIPDVTLTFNLEQINLLRAALFSFTPTGCGCDGHGHENDCGMPGWTDWDIDALDEVTQGVDDALVQAAIANNQLETGEPTPIH